MSAFDRYRRLPLRAKLAACVTLGASVLVMALVWASLWMLRDASARTASDAQAALIDGVAHDLDEKIAFRLHALESQSAVLGHRVPLGDDGDARASALDDFFVSRPMLDSLFNAMLVVDAHGRVIHDFPRNKKRLGLDLSDRAYVRRVLTTKAPVIAEPLTSRFTGKPVINMAVPVWDDHGETVGALIGQLFLDEQNFISDIGRRREGTFGHFVMLGEGDVVIAHPDRTQLLQRMPPGASGGLSAARRGASAAMLARDETGEELLSSYRLLAAAPWVIQAVYPTSEAYAQLRSRERAAVGVGGAAALIAGMLMWSLTSRLLRPLDDLRRAMGDDADARAAADLLRADSADLAALLDAYRTQSERRRTAEALLARSERRLHDIADNIPALVSYVDRDQRYGYTNGQYRKTLGFRDAIGKTIVEVLGPALHAELEPHVLAALSGIPQEFERTYAGAAGVGHVMVNFVPALGDSGGVEGFYTMMVDITARKAAENRLAVSERRLRAITDNLPAMIGYVDREERYRFLNADYRRVFGVEPEALLDKTVRELMGETGYAEVKPHVDGALRGERQHFERFGPRAGSDMYALVDYIPDVGADGSVDGYYVMVLDLSARKRAELALAESERRVRAIADSIPALIVHYDRDERITFANAQVARLRRRTPESMIGKTLRKMRGNTTYAMLQPHVRRVLHGEQVDFEIDGPFGDEVHHYASTYVPDHGADGAVVGFYAFTLDITERKKMELSLARSEQRVRTITDNLPALISHYDCDRRYTFANRTVGKLFGMDTADLIGRTVREARGDAAADIAEPHLNRALTGETVTFDAEASLSVGAPLRHFQATYLPEIDPEGRVQGVYALTFDITERKNAELARLASERRLNELINTIPAMVGYFDMEQRCQFANDTALRSLGVERSEVPGIAMRTALGETIWAQHAPHLDDVLAGARARFEGKVPFRGREAHYQAHLIPDRDASDTQRGYYLMTFDVTAMKEAQQRQARVEAQLRSVTDNLPVLISYVDREWRFTFLNETFNAWMGIEPATVLGRPVREVIGEVMYAEREAYFQRVFAGERVEFEVASTTQTGLRHLKTVYVPDIETDGTVVGAFCLSTDVTAMKNAERQLGLLVRSDALTGLANRYRFNEALPDSLARARRSGMALALMFLDIDRFKQINDHLGHGVGDEALQEFAARLQRSVRLTDLVARLAGDEFVIILEGLHSEGEAQAIARKILAEINRPFLLSAGPLSVTTSLGIAYQTGASVGEDNLLARADEALYQAKSAGRNTYRLLTAA